ESHSPWFEHVEKRSVATVRAKLAEALGVSLGESLIIVVTKRFPSGRVCELMVNGRTMSGRRLREILELRSSWFSVQQTSSELVFTVKGYGHGVGMSQYGADGYAQRGWSYQQILSHYYQGASLVVR
ncbi:MAG: SpoIID/LytB domain-containing protein, partial [Methanothrix sp.]|nr:SpoIID/LytB domain-containing protein [Methanothrix sp.]